MSLHLGSHWGIMMGMAKRFVREISIAGKWLLRGIVALIAGYGVYAFWRRDIWNYLILRNHFAFFDFEEPVVFFLMDYVAVMILFVWMGHYFSNKLRCTVQSGKNR